MGLIGAALGAVGSIVGGLSAANAMGKYKKGLEQQIQDEKDYAAMQTGGDGTQRGDIGRVLNKTEETFKRRNKQAAATQAVMGGTNEALAAEKEAATGALADAYSQAGATVQQRNDKIMEQSHARVAGLNQQLNQANVDQANAITAAIKGVTGAAGGMDFGEITTGTKKDGTPKTLSL